MAQVLTSTTNYSQTVVALVQKRLEDLLRAPLPHLTPGNFRPAQFVAGTNNTMRFINVPDLTVTAGTPSAGTPPWLAEATTPTALGLTIGYEEFSANQAGQFIQLSDLAMLESPFDLMREAADRVARNAIAVADKRVAEVLITGTNVIYANGGTSSTGFPFGASPLTGAVVKRAVALLAGGLVPTFADGTYHAIVHPGAVYDLMTDTAVGGWVDAARYAGARQLMTGELGEYAGVRFQSSAAAGTKLAQTSAASLPTVTGTAATDLINSTAHGLSAGMRVKLTGLTGGAGLTSGTTYYVVAPVTANSFKVSATANGTPIDITTDLTVCTTGAQVYDVYSTTIFGPESYAFGDWTGIQTYFTPPGGGGDELHQRASVGWKGFFGAVIIGQGANATNVSPPRYIRIESVSQIS
jgi:N4-gp56 family major capsid protein